MENVPDQVAQGFVVIHGPCGGDGTGMKNPTSLRTFPIDDLRNGLLVPYPRPMAFGIEIDDVSFVVAAGDRDDALGFHQPLQSRVLGRPQQGREPYVELMTDRPDLVVNEAEDISLFQVDLVRLVEKEMFRQVTNDKEENVASPPSPPRRNVELGSARYLA